MTETLRAELDRLFADEPSVEVTVEAVVRDGKRLRARRRWLISAAIVGVTAVGALGALAVSGALERPRPVHSLAVAPYALSGEDTASPSGLTDAQRRIAEAIVAASPSGWTFEMTADRWEQDAGVEATADDGAGPGRLMVGISEPAGSQQVHPCTDPEFKAGVTCTERTLANGSVLSMRGPVDWHGTKYLDVVLTHPDGTGVMAESGNFVIDWPPPQVVTPEQKRHLTHVTRPAPTYTVDQLADVVLAIDRAIS